MSIFSGPLNNSHVLLLLFLLASLEILALCSCYLVLVKQPQDLDVVKWIMVAAGKTRRVMLLSLLVWYVLKPFVALSQFVLILRSEGEVCVDLSYCI